MEAKRSKMFVSEVDFCGHILSNVTRKPAPGKLRVIEKWEPPRNITELRAFLGLTNYYNTYVKDSSRIARCLQEKLKVPRAEGEKGARNPFLGMKRMTKQFRK